MVYWIGIDRQGLDSGELLGLQNVREELAEDAAVVRD